MTKIILIAAAYGMENQVKLIIKTLLPLIVLLGVVSILKEILRSAHRSRKWQRKRPRKKHELSRVEIQMILALVALLVLAAFEWWLWECLGRFWAIAIHAGVVVLGIIVILWCRKRVISKADRTAPSSRDVCQPYPNTRIEDLDVEIVDVAQREGKKGEAMVREIIKSLPTDRYVVLHDVWLPMEAGDETQIDHVIVSIFGIFIVETKNWKGIIYGDAKSPVWTKYNHGQKAIYKNPIRQNYKHIISIYEKFMRPEKEFVFGVVAMSPTAEFKYGVPEGVVYYNELKGWILKHIAPCIKAEQVAEIVAAIQEWSATVSKEARQRHCEKNILVAGDSLGGN